MLSSPFMQRAFVEVLVLAVLAGIVGTMVLIRRQAFVTDAMSHTVFPGIAVASFTGHSLFAGALAAGVVSAVIMTVLTRLPRAEDDAILALLIATFFAFGVAVVSRRRTFSADLTSLLAGRLLTIDATTIATTIVITAIVIAVVVLIGKELLFVAFDPEAAVAAGYRLAVLDLVTNVLVALVVVASVRAIGTALVVAILVTPTAIGRIISNRLGVIAALSCVAAAACGVVGLIISYQASVYHGVRLEAGATITSLLTVVFVVIAAGRTIARRIAAPAVS